MTGPAKALLDTDILSALMRRTPVVVEKAQEYLAEHGAFSFSIITRYEILRGLKAKDATVQLQAFDRLCQTCEILPLSDAAIVIAAEVYATLTKRGALSATPTSSSAPPPWSTASRS